MRDIETIYASTPPQAGSAVVQSALARIQMHAQPVQARAVFRAAGLCIHKLSIGANAANANLISALTSLRHLINQYANGLYEIDPEFRSIIENAQVLDAKEVSAVAPNSLIDDNNRARNVLRDVVHLSRNQRTASALKSLMSAAQPSNHCQASNMPGRKVSFDSVLDNVISLTLSEARHSGKTVSVSYAGESQSLMETTAKPFQDFLEILCLNIIARGVDTNSQISITEKSGVNCSHVEVHWQGHDIMDARTYLTKAVYALTQNGGTLQTTTGDKNGDETQDQCVAFTFPYQDGPQLKASA